MLSPDEDLEFRALWRDDYEEEPDMPETTSKEGFESLRVIALRLKDERDTLLEACMKVRTLIAYMHGAPAHSGTIDRISQIVQFAIAKTEDANVQS